MSLVTVARYITITGDAQTDAGLVSAAIEEVEADLEEVLDRPLENTERTEAIRPDRGGMLWPRATPITDGGDYVVDGLGLRAENYGVVPSFVGGTGEVSVTYTGGWTAETLPRVIERAIAWAAYDWTHPGERALSSDGVTSKRLGDVAVAFDSRGPRTRADAQIRWPARVLRYRYAPPRGTGR